MFERGTTPCRPIGFAGALALLLAAPASASPEEPVQAGAESPQELGKLLQEVAAADDPAKMIGLVVPEDRPQLAMLQLLPAIFIVSMAEPLGDMVAETGEAVAGAVGGEETADEAQARGDEYREDLAAATAVREQRLRSILERHGLEALLDEPGPDDDGQAAQQLESLFATVDYAALFRDLDGFLAEFEDASAEKTSEEETSEADRDLPPITDYRIEGDRATARHGDEELVFRRVDDRWYLVLAERETPY